MGFVGGKNALRIVCEGLPLAPRPAGSIAVWWQSEQEAGLQEGADPQPAAGAGGRAGSACRAESLGDTSSYQGRMSLGQCDDAFDVGAPPSLSLPPDGQVG